MPNRREHDHLVTSKFKIEIEVVDRDKGYATVRLNGTNLFEAAAPNHTSSAISRSTFRAGSGARLGCRWLGVGGGRSERHSRRKRWRRSVMGPR